MHFVFFLKSNVKCFELYLIFIMKNAKVITLSIFFFLVKRSLLKIFANIVESANSNMLIILLILKL